MWGEAVYREFLYIPVKFYCKPKTALKKEKDLQKKFNTQGRHFGQNFCFTFMYVYILYMCMCLLDCDIKCIFLDQRSLQATMVNYTGK